MRSRAQNYGGPRVAFPIALQHNFHSFEPSDASVAPRWTVGISTSDQRAREPEGLTAVHRDVHLPRC